MPPTDLWFGTSGPRDAPIVLVGEAFGAEEAACSRPFVGSSGVELSRILAEAGVKRDEILLTNVVAARPQNNEMWRLFEPKGRVDKAQQKVGGLYPAQFVQDEVRRLYSHIAAHPRRLIICAGNYPLWALTNHSGAEVIRSSNNRPVPPDLQTYVPTGIMSWRGSMTYGLRDRFHSGDSGLHNGSRSDDVPVLPIIHPAAIMRQWSLRAVIVHDLKARVRMALAGDWRPDPPPVFWAPPTFLQCTAQLAVWLARADAGEQIRIAEDIETARGLITCLGLSDSPQFAMSIPFVRKTDSGTFDSWWSQDEEGMLMVLLRRLNTHQNILIEGQNFIYDTQYIQHWLAVTPRLDFDTMLAQNVLFPGTPKSLDYLSSLFCKYHWYWKEDHKEWDMSGTIEQLLLYNCMDCVRTYECATTLRALIVQLKQTEQWKLKMQINDLCLRMMNRGVLIDTKGRAALSMQLAETISQLEHDLHTIVPQDVVAPDAKRPWFSSPQQTAYLFYDRLGFRVETQRKTKRPTVGKDARVALATRYPEFTGLFERLRLHGSCENTHNVINAGLDPDDRMRCSFNPGGAETHRLSSSKNAFGRGTNLQNLTKGEEDE